MARHEKFLWSGFASVVIGIAMLAGVWNGAIVGGFLLLIAGVIIWAANLK